MNNTVFFLEKINLTTEETELIGVFSSEDLALAEMETRDYEDEEEDYSYSITEVIVDKTIEEQTEFFEQQFQDEIEQDLIQLMKDEIIDQLIDEDGKFVYKLTEKGKKIAERKKRDTDF